MPLMISTDSGKPGIELHMGPDSVGGPDDLENAIVDFIDGAEYSLEIAVQELENEAIARAIANARLRGVKVKMIVKASYLQEDKPLKDPFVTAGANEQNRELANILRRAAVDLREDFNHHGIFHQKFIVRDLGEPTRALLTGSTNFTDTGTGSNLNHVVILHSARAAKEYSDQFHQYWDGGDFGWRAPQLKKKPAEFHVAGVPIKICFAPQHHPEMEIMKRMSNARSSIEFGMFTFSNSSGIDDIMKLQLERGAYVRGAMDNNQGSAKWAVTKQLAEGGANVYLARPRDGLRKLHHKMMVLDEKVTILGSFNYTGPANALNDENILVLGSFDFSRLKDDPIAQADRLRKQQEIALYATNEIDRIVMTYGAQVKRSTARQHYSRRQRAFRSSELMGPV